MSEPVPSYEPEIIERYAASLAVRARRFYVGAMVTGAIVGLALGAVPLLRLDLWPFPSRFALAPVLVGVLVGGLLGRAVGSGRAELYRLHTQMVLCQLHAQRATLAIWKVVRDRPVADAQPAPMLEVAPELVLEADPEPEPQPAEGPLVPPLTAPLLRLPSADRATA